MVDLWSWCVCVQYSYCVCTNLDGLNAEDKVQIWVTILGLHVTFKSVLKLILTKVH